MRNIAVLACMAALTLACNDKGDSAAGFDHTSFQGGNFQFTTTGVADTCYDGIDLIFMPQGDQVPNDWAATTELPSWADLPASYDLTVPMSVTVEEQSAGVMGISDQAQPEPVPLDEDNYPKCLLNITISAALTIVDADNLQGSTTMESEGYTGNASCPVVESDPCTITLDVTATRVN